MKFKIGIDKFPLIKFDSDKYAHVFPVTKYQFGRYISETGPAIDYDYDKMFPANPRKSAYEINKKNLSSLFITNVSINEAINYSIWARGHLPTIYERKNIIKVLSETYINNILNYCESNKNSLDIRLLYVLSKLIDIGVKTMKELHECLSFGEFFTELTEPIDDSYGDIYVAKLFGEAKKITGVGIERMLIRGNFGFRVIVSEYILEGD